MTEPKAYDYRIRVCGDCPWSGTMCGHPAVDVIDYWPRAVDESEPPPEWCPLRREPRTLRVVDHD